MAQAGTCLEYPFAMQSRLRVALSIVSPKASADFQGERGRIDAGTRVVRNWIELGFWVDCESGALRRRTPIWAAARCWRSMLSAMGWRATGNVQW